MNTILSDYLNYEQPFDFKGSMRHSNFIAALRECRMFTRRKIRNGELDNTSDYGYPGHWLGAIGYLTILDQIGSCFKPLGESNKMANENSIEYALKSFGFEELDNNQLKIDAIVSLRNAFTHDFNLVNIPTNKNKISSQQHRFTVYWAEDDVIVELPKELWDGNISQKDFKNRATATRINLFELGNLVEKIYVKIKTGIENNEIEIQLDIDTFINKYTFVEY